MRTADDFDLLPVSNILEHPLLVAANKVRARFAEAGIGAFVNHLRKRGDVTDGHGHNFDHVTFIWKGRIGIECVLPDGSEVVQVVDEGDCVTIKKGVEHRIVALVDNTVYMCLYAHRNPDGEVIERSVGYAPAYR